MSSHARTRPAYSASARSSSPDTASILARVEAEMRENFIEVPVEGITFKQLVAAYTVILRDGRDRMLEGVRSLFRLHPAH